MVNRKPYGLENEKLAGNKPRGGMPMVLDDRLISKQYIKDKLDDRIKNDEFDASTWDNDTENTASREVIFNKISSLTAVADVWTKKSADADSNIRAAKTGNYAIGPANFTGDSAWEKLYVAGSIKATGDFIMATDGSKVGPSSGYLTLHSTNGALLPTKFMIGTGTAGVPLEISLAADTPAPTKADGTGIIQAGANAGANLGIGADRIQARDGAGEAAELKINTTAGAVSIGSATGTTTINGDLVVEGTATTTLSETVNIKDSDITLNSNLAGDTAPVDGADAGITVNRGSLNPARIIWDEGADNWQLDNGTDDPFVIAHDSHAPMTLGETNADNALSLSGQAISLADKFVHKNGDTMTGPLTIGSASTGDNDGEPTLIVWGEDLETSTVPALKVRGIMEAAAKEFNIEHPLKKGMRLVHGCLEGPEFGVYQRGTLKSNLLIEEIALPEWWKVIVGDYTVLLTPHGNYNVWLEEKNKTMFKIKTSADAIDGPWSCEWYAVGRRLDVKLEVEQNANE